VPHVRVTVDDAPLFDGEVEQWQLPQPPDLLGPLRDRVEVRNAKPSPFVKTMRIATFGMIFKKAMEDPRFAPLDVGFQTRPTGWTLTIDMPAPLSSADDMEV
jgi:hypothetical protein